MCGTISPTKPRRPAKLIAAPHIAAASVSSSSRTGRTESPRLIAVCVPRDSTSICRDSDSASTMPSRIMTAAGASCAIVTPEKPPILKSE